MNAWNPIPAAILIAIVSALPLAAESDVVTPDPFWETASLRLSFRPADGGFTLTALAEGGGAISTTPMPGLSVDGEPQQGFVAVEGGYRNDLLDLRIEPVAARAIALSFTVRDGASRALRFRLRSDDETAYYGTGERFNALNQRGYILPMRVDDRYGNKGVGSHKPVPFFMSSRGFAVWVDSFAPATFDLSGSERFNTDLHLHDSRMRIVLIGGPHLAAMLDTFTALTGRPAVPPGWAFALWKSRDVHRNRDEVLEDVEKLRRYRIPASVVVLDSPWETGYNDFTLNRQQFTGAGEMLARIEELGFHLALWLTPFVNDENVRDMHGIEPRSRNFDEAAAAGHLVRRADGSVARMEWWKGRGGLVDFTSPAAKAWWFSQLRKTKDYGARAFKCDDGEGNFVPDAIFHDGTPAHRMKNRYSILYNEAMQEYVDRELGGDGVLIVRSGTTGVQRTPFAWAGDNRADFSFEDGLPSVVIAAQNAALSGIPMWGSDIAGYAGTPDKELFIRWTQFATFTPFMQVHMTSNLGPWDFDEETLEIFRKFAVLRMQLFPYLYAAAREAERSGLPVIRPMALAYPDDPEARRQTFQFLFGADLLVAPMIQRGTSRSVYLPRGVWYAWWSGRRHEGPVSIEIAAPLDVIPLFVRGGTILPMLPADVQTLVPRHPKMSPDVMAIDERRLLRIWPGPAGRLANEGIEAELDGDTLRITTATARPLEVELVGRRLADSERRPFTSRADATVIPLEPFRGTIGLELAPLAEE